MRTLRWSGWRKRGEICVGTAAPGCPAGRRPALNGRPALDGRTKTQVSWARLDSRWRLTLRSSFLFFCPRVLPGGCVHGDPQLSGFATGSVDHVPQNSVAWPVPVQHVKNRCVGLLLQQFVAAVLLGDGEGLVGIDLEGLDVENLGGGIRRTVGVVDTVRDIAVAPGIGLNGVQRRRGESNLPD